MKHLIAVIRSDRLEEVETRLKDAEAPGLSVSTVKGYGEHASFLSHDWTVRHVRLDVFAEDGDIPSLVGLISEAARTGIEGDGLLAVEPVERFLHIRSRKDRSWEAGRRATATSPRAETSSVVPVLWVAVTALGLVAIAVSVVVSAKHQLHLLSLALLAVLVLSAAVGLFSLTRRGPNNPRR